MTASERREAILSYLHSSDSPVSASSLAARLSVSRQIIVGDIALLRAAGHEIEATPRGYVLPRGGSGMRRTVACVHSVGDTARELYAIVDNGCTAIDVVVEHPIYGQIVGQLQIRSRYDVDRFVEKLEGAPPLSALTGGIHLHTIECSDEEAYRRVLAALRREGFLLEEQA